MKYLPKAIFPLLAPPCTQLKKKSLAWGAKLMTLECGIRFLTDYLEGDHYFHIARPNHNLDRARTQFTLVRQMEDVFDQMTAIVCPETDL